MSSNVTPVLPSGILDVRNMLQRNVRVCAEYSVERSLPSGTAEEVQTLLLCSCVLCAFVHVVGKTLRTCSNLIVKYNQSLRHEKMFGQLFSINFYLLRMKQLVRCRDVCRRMDEGLVW